MADIDAAYQSTRARLRTGFALIGGGAVLAIGIFFTDAIVRASLEGSKITVLARSAVGLTPGSAVWVAGRPVGRVLSVSFRPVDHVSADPVEGPVVIEAVLDRIAEPMVRADATAEVRPPDLLAPVIVAVDPGTGSAPPWNFSDTLRAGGPPLDPEALLARADTLVQAVRVVEARATEARRTLASAGGSFRRLREDPGTIEGLRRDFDTLRDLAGRDFSRSSLARLAADTLLAATAERVRERVAAWNASPERRASGRSLETAVAVIDAMGIRFASLARRIERGEGTAGRALMDDEIQRQLEALRSTADALAEELMLNPSRWLRVRVF